MTAELPIAEVERGIGRAIELFRFRAGMSRDDLAASAEPQLSRSAVLKIEKGERVPSPETLRRIAVALDVSTDMLLVAAWVAAEDDLEQRAARAQAGLSVALFGQSSSAVRAGAAAGLGVIALLGAPVAVGALAAFAAGSLVQDRERRAGDARALSRLQEEVVRRIALIDDPDELQQLLESLPAAEAE